MTSITDPSRFITTPTTLSPNGSGAGLPITESARSRSSSSVTIFSPAAFRRSAISGRAGLTAMPYSVTTTSTVRPGVMSVVTSFTTHGILPRSNGQTMIESAESSAVSGCPPIAPRMMPSLPTSTLTLKLTSTSRAERITMSR